MGCWPGGVGVVVGVVVVVVARRACRLRLFLWRCFVGLVGGVLCRRAAAPPHRRMTGRLLLAPLMSSGARSASSPPTTVGQSDCHKRPPSLGITLRPTLPVALCARRINHFGSPHLPPRRLARRSRREIGLRGGSGGVGGEGRCAAVALFVAAAAALFRAQSRARARKNEARE